MAYTPNSIDTVSTGYWGRHYDAQNYPDFIHYVVRAPLGGYPGVIYKLRATPAETLLAGTTTLTV